MDNKIVYIKLEDIIPHPNNPRKELGDLEEMAADIKENGLLQNLMVIPVENGKYMTLIGHRRSAAARLAGLTEVPCTVADKDLPMNEQVAIMLRENMQRTALTDVEQADGFQLMFDLGDTVSEISQKTGFSESTIYKRRQLLQYPREKVIAAYDRGGNFGDYSYLEKVKDPETKEKLLAYMGTSSFKWQVDSAVQAEEREEYLKPFCEFMDNIAERAESFDYNTMVSVKSINCENIKPEDITIDGYDENRKYYYVPSTYSKAISLYAERIKQDKAEEDAEAKERRRKEQERAERHKKLTSIFEHMEQSCFEFIRNFKTFPGKKATEKLNTIYRINTLLIEFALTTDNHKRVETDTKRIAEILVCKDAEEDEIKNALANSTEEKEILLIAYALIRPWQTPISMDYHCRYVGNDCLTYLYEIMKLAGYELSDEERAILNGTHELYVKEN